MVPPERPLSVSGFERQATARASPLVARREPPDRCQSVRGSLSDPQARISLRSSELRSLRETARKSRPERATSLPGTPQPVSELDAETPDWCFLALSHLRKAVIVLRELERPRGLP